MKAVKTALPSLLLLLWTMATTARAEDGFGYGPSFKPTAVYIWNNCNEHLEARLELGRTIETVPLLYGECAKVDGLEERGAFRYHDPYRGSLTANCAEIVKSDAGRSNMLSCNLFNDPGEIKCVVNLCELDQEVGKGSALQTNLLRGSSNNSHP